MDRRIAVTLLHEIRPAAVDSEIDLVRRRGQIDTVRGVLVSVANNPPTSVDDARNLLRDALLGNDDDDDGRPVTDADLQPCLLYTSPSPRDLSTSRMPSSA